MAALVAAAALVTASGCAGNANAGATSGVEKPDLNVAVVPAPDSAGFFVALYGGLFAKAGLHIKFTPATSSDTVISGQVNGQYDITGGNYVSYIQAQASREPFASAAELADGAIPLAGCCILPTRRGTT